MDAFDQVIQSLHKFKKQSNNMKTVNNEKQLHNKNKNKNKGEKQQKQKHKNNQNKSKNKHFYPQNYFIEINCKYFQTLLIIKYLLL